MTKAELIQVYAYARAMWSSFETPEGEREGKMMDLVWFDVLRKYDLPLIFTAMKEHAKESDFCNIAKIGEICKNLSDIANGNFVDEESVIVEIRRAIASPSPNEAFEKLSPIAKEIVQGPWQIYRWGMSSVEAVETVIMSHIRRSVANRVKTKKSEDLVKQIEAESYIMQNLLEYDE